MGSESLFTKCKTCGKEISKSVKACPQCGAKQKKLSIIHWIGIGFLGLIIIGIANAPDKASQSSGEQVKSSVSPKAIASIDSLMPTEQVRFIETVSKHARDFKGVKNELQQSAMRDQRKAAISGSLEGYSVASWVGTINQLETNTEGKAILSVRISPDIEIKTWNNALSDIASNTLIGKGSSLYGSLFDLSVGQKIEFSGSFFPSETDFVEETSMTIDGSMRNPEFLFKFRSVRPIQ